MFDFALSWSWLEVLVRILRWKSLVKSITLFANSKNLRPTTYIVAKVSSQPKLFRSRRRVASLPGTHGSVADQDKGRRLFNKPVGIVALGVSDTTSNYRRFFPCYVSSPASKSNLSFLIEQIFSPRCRTVPAVGHRRAGNLRNDVYLCSLLLRRSHFHNHLCTRNEKQEHGADTGNHGEVSAGALSLCR